jgi:hypothetical protein
MSNYNIRKTLTKTSKKSKLLTYAVTDMNRPNATHTVTFTVDRTGDRSPRACTCCNLYAKPDGLCQHVKAIFKYA